MTGPRSRQSRRMARLLAERMFRPVVVQWSVGCASAMLHTLSTRKAPSALAGPDAEGRNGTTLSALSVRPFLGDEAVTVGIFAVRDRVIIAAERGELPYME